MQIKVSACPEQACCPDQACWSKQHLVIEKVIKVHSKNGHVLQSGIPPYSSPHYTDYVTAKSKRLRGEHEPQYITVPTKTDVFKFSYFSRTVRCWNILHAPLVLKLSAGTFKNSLQAAPEDGLV